MDPTQYAAIKSISDPGKARVMMFANGQPAHAPMNAVTAASVHNATAKATPVDADEFGYYDSVSAGPVKATWANIKATLKTYFDTLYQPLAAALTSWAAITRASGFDTFTATPTSANLAALLTDETGSGAAVFATAPTFSGSVVITGGTPRLGVGANTGSPGERLSVGYGENVDLAIGSATSMKSYWGSFNDNAVVAINRRVSDGNYASASLPTADFGFYLFSGDAQIRFQTGSTNGSGLSTERMRINGAGFISVLGGSFGRGAPVTKTADFTVAATENNLINNKSGSSCTVTLPTASSFPGREILIKNSQAQTVVSASSNVVPRVTAAAGTAILASGSGNWAKLVSDGTNWVIMAGS